SSPARDRYLRNKASRLWLFRPNTSTSSHPLICLMRRCALVDSGTSLGFPLLVLGRRQKSPCTLSHVSPHNSPALMPVRKAIRKHTATACVVLATLLLRAYPISLSIALISHHSISRSR